MQSNHTNELIHETSPYLLQHAHNPVDWHAWKAETFKKAQELDKPILVSIGYSTCHWCHVMERESFEDPSVALLMNELFINIKVDREERPDIDMIYMDAVQLLTGAGGWPLNCFLLPDGRAFYGGTYFPPSDNYGRPSWRQVLTNISSAYQHKKATVIEQAEKLMQAIKANENRFIGNIEPRSETEGPTDFANKLFAKLQDQFDDENGGFGSAPKFPQTQSLDLLMALNYYTKNVKALEHIEKSLQKMSWGGIYDHLGGGFARYATDIEWLVPHFEKMLYDNALLIRSFAEIYKITQNKAYLQVIDESIAFVQNELMHPEGGFYSALDADSEGVEGKFYVWDKHEIDEILGADAKLFCDVYNVKEKGNWEETNILHLKQSMTEYAEKHGLVLEEFQEKIKFCREKLLAERNKRIRPSLDDKILLSWNALMITALAEAGMASNNEVYKQLAIDQLEVLLKYFTKENGQLYHSYKNGVAKIDGMLEDYAFLIEALLVIFNMSQNDQYLLKAAELSDKVIELFHDEKQAMFYFTDKHQGNIILRKKELFDNATPSANAVMCRNLTILGLIFDNTLYSELSEKMLLTIDRTMKLYPSSFAYWAKTACIKQFSIEEIVVSGEEKKKAVSKINSLYSSARVIMQTELVLKDWTMLQNKEQTDELYIYLCRHNICLQPVTSVESFKSLLKNG